MTDQPLNDSDWWRSAVTYQIYIRSFADSNGDGMGDVNGIRSKLAYIASLGVDALWINPWYPSPQADAGYDVADYRDVEPEFGSLEEGKALIAEAHAAGLRVLLDIVPNHTSDEHVWFQAALASPPGSPERARYHFRPGKSVHGDEPPNDWVSEFGGTAWTRLDEPDGEWYLHLFDVRQPDLNWDNEEVRDEFLDILRFWFDAGADGFRIDVAHGLLKAKGLPDIGPQVKPRLGDPPMPGHPHWDQSDVPDIYRAWREVADSYDPPRVFVAEAWVSSVARLAEYLTPDCLHTAFDFHTTRCKWDVSELRTAITSSLAAHRTVGAPVTWVLSNHDIDRHVSRYGRVATAHPLHGRPDEPVDVPLGTRRARAAILMELALPGLVYMYQGEELGLPQVDDIPESMLADPVWERSGHTRRGRDGCRVPVPWTRTGSSFGFSTGDSWLPQPGDWGELSVEAEEADHSSMLWLYRNALHLRRDLPALHADELTWLDLGGDVLAFMRGDRFACIVNFGEEALDLPGGEVLASSEPLDGPLPTDTAAWVRLDERLFTQADRVRHRATAAC
ncbi:MAG: glycoside hydrolase family 13 protein [Ilumatobacteraceae bacterium]